MATGLDPARVAPPARGELRLRGDHFDFSVPLGGEAPVLVSGGSVWEDVTRPQRDSLTDYTGDALTRLDVPVLLNGWVKRHNIRPQVDRILELCRGQAGNRPPAFTATGPIPYSGGKFVLEGFPEWGESLGEDEVLYRQELTLHLVEFNDPSVIRFRRERKQGSSGNGGVSSPPSAITLRSPMTLLEVSASYYGTPRFAKTIGDLNGIRDVRKKLPAGKKLRLPKGWPDA